MSPADGAPPAATTDPVGALLSHTVPPVPEVDRPLAHLERNLNDADAMLTFYRHAAETGGASPQALADAAVHLRRMVLVTFIEAFERFLKDLAIVCVDRLAPRINDGRFEKLQAGGGEAAAMFASRSVGRALCESRTWLSNEEVNARFRQILKSRFGGPWGEAPLPNAGQRPVGRRATAGSVAVLWQVRHTIVHNAGRVTDSDALKLTTLTGTPVPAGGRFAPEEDDILRIKRFLEQAAARLHVVIGERLAAVLTDIHVAGPTLFDPAAEADALAAVFGHPLTVAGQTGNPQ